MKPAQSLQRTLALLSLVGLAVFGCVESNATRFYTWPWVFYGELLLLAPVLLLALDLWREPRPLLPRSTVLAWLGVAAAVALSGALGPRPRFSLETALFLWGALALAALLARRVAAGSFCAPVRLRLAGAFLVLPALSSALLWTTELRTLVHNRPAGSSLLAWLMEQRNLHPAGHWNYTGGLALLALPWLLVLVWSERGRWRLLWLLLSGITALVFLSAVSRGATLGLLAAAAAAGLAVVRTRGLGRRRLALFLAVLVGLAGVLAVANPRVRAVFVGDPGIRIPTEGDVQRLAMLDGGIRLFLARPWTGHGAGTTPFVYPSVRAALVGGVETSFQLHNTPLQWAVDHGSLGIVAALAAALAVFAGAHRRPAGDPLRPYALASGCTVVGYGVLAVTDYQLDVVAIAAALAFHLGFLLGGTPPPAAVAQPARRRLGGLLLVGATAAALVVLGPQWRARRLFSEAWYAADTGDGATCLARLREAADAAPWEPLYRSQLGLFLGERAATPAARDFARRELEQSIGLDPLQEPVEAALGWLWLLDDPAQAERHFRAALRLGPDRPTVHLGLAYACLRQSRPAPAIQALATECLVNPSFVASPLWNVGQLALVRDSVRVETERQLTCVLADPHLPAWRRPALTYIRAFIRWWRDGTLPEESELHGASPAQHATFGQLADTAHPRRPPTPLPPSLERLAAALAARDGHDTLLRADTRITPPAVEGALARLAAHPNATLAALLRSPSPEGKGIVSTRIVHGHFAIMQRNLDSPGYPDLYARVTDSFTETFVGPLYPPTGLVPGPVLVDLDTDLRPDAPRVPIPAPAQ